MAVGTVSFDGPELHSAESQDLTVHPPSPVPAMPACIQGIRGHQPCIVYMLAAPHRI